MITRRGIWTLAAMAAIGTPSEKAASETLPGEASATGAVGVASADSEPSSIGAVADLAAMFGGPLRVLPIVGRGPVQDAADLLRKGVDVALVPSDVLPYLRRTGRLPAADQALLYIAELYREDVHVLAQRNFAGIADLAGRPV